MRRLLTPIVIALAIAPSLLAQDQPPAAAPPASTPAPASKDLEITNTSKTAVILYPKHAAAEALIDPPSEITLKPGETAHLKVRADWPGPTGTIDFLPETAVRAGYAYPYGAAPFTPAHLASQITDDAIPRPGQPLKKLPDPPAPAARPKPPLPWPHPLITEILYATPTGASGDANKDGSRDTCGDEFVELVNPHDKPIDLRGYTISGKSPEAPAPGKKFTVLKFTFPACTLGPGEIAVVFNGHASKWNGPIGDTTHASSGNPYFCNARTFTMNVESSRLGFSNKADYVLLTAPGGEKVHCIKWGEIKPPDKVTLVETAPEVNGQSVFRRAIDGALEPHPSLEGLRFSPGRFPLDQQVSPPPPTPPPSTSPAAPTQSPTPPHPTQHSKSRKR